MSADCVGNVVLGIVPDRRCGVRQRLDSHALTEAFAAGFRKTVFRVRKFSISKGLHSFTNCAFTRVELHHTLNQTTELWMTGCNDSHFLGSLLEDSATTRCLIWYHRCNCQLAVVSVPFEAVGVTLVFCLLILLDLTPLSSQERAGMDFALFEVFQEHCSALVLPKR